jgi:hypothetical protein
MNLRPAASLACLLLVAAAIASLFFVRALKPTSMVATVLISIWLLLPYMILAVIVSLRTRLAIEMANLAVALLVAAGGLLFLTMVIFVQPDPQGGIAVFFTPLYQGIAMIVLFPLLRSVFGSMSRFNEKD